MNEDGAISLAMVVDTSNADKQLDKELDKIDDFTTKASKRTSALAEELAGIPKSVSVSFDIPEADTAIAISKQLDDMISQNQSSLDALDKEWRELTKTIADIESQEVESSRKLTTAREDEQRAMAKLRQWQEQLAESKRKQASQNIQATEEEKQAEEQLRLELEQAAETARKEAEAQQAAAIASRTAAEAAKRQQEAISKLSAERKRVISEAEKEKKALKDVVSQMSVEQRVTIALQGGYSSMKQLTRELQAEMIALEANGQRNTQRFAELAAGAARLSDAMTDARAQTNILANDNAGFAGMISAMSGVSGGFTAVSGAMSLFGSESEDLQKIMLRVQSLMAITTGLQQMSVMLNKDSAASLVILNGVKSLWGKITGSNNAIATEEVQTTAAATAAKVEDTAATEADTTAENQNTAAIDANTAARQENTQLTSENAGAKVMDANASKQGAAAQGALAESTKKTSVAVRGLKMLMKTTVILAVISGIMALVSWLGELMTKLSGTEKAMKAVNEATDKSLEAYAKAKTELEQYKSALQRTITSKEEEKKLCDELNRKYGEQLGYHKTQAEWLETITQKGDVYCESMKRQAQSQALLNAYTDAYIRYLQLLEKQKQYDAKTKWDKLWSSSPAKDLKDAQEEMKYLEAEWEKVNKEAQQFAIENDVNFHIDPDSNKSKSTFDPKKAAEQVFNAYKTYQEYVEKFAKQTNDAISQANLQYMQDGLNKDLYQSRANFKRLIEEWENQFNEYGQALKQRQHDIYMSKQGATEEGWRNSAEGKMTDKEWLDKVLSSNEELYKQYYAHIERLQRECVLEQQQIQQKYTDSLIDQYGTTEQKIEQLERKFLQMFTNIPENDPLWDYFDEIEKQLNQKVANLKLEDLKKSLNWEEVFGDMDSVSTRGLEVVKKKLQQIVKSQKDLSPEAMKTLVDAIKKIDEETASRNPFGNLISSVKDLTKSTEKVEEAQRLYNEALQSGNDKLIQSAEQQLTDTQNQRQKSLANLTKSLQSASKMASDLMGVVNGIFGMFEQFGVEIPQELKGFAEGIGDVVNALSDIDLTKPMSIIKGAIGTIGGLFKSISSLFNHDSQREKNIQRLQKQIDRLQESYERLNKEIERTYSTDSAKLINQQTAMLEQQRRLVQRQMQEEKDKKHTDKDKIDEYQKKLRELDEQIEENKLKAKDAIFGSDLKSAIEDFATAYANAWTANENRTKTAKEVVKDMMRQMVTESIKAAIQSSEAMERIRDRLHDYFNDGILQDWEQQAVFRMAEDLQKQLDEQFGWADSLMKDSNFQQNGSSGGFQAMSEDTASELNGRFTALVVGQERIAENVETMQDAVTNGFYGLQNGIEELQNINLLQLQQLENINRNTKALNDTNDLLERIERNTKNL